MFVSDQDGGTPLDGDRDQGAGEEANSPAGGARGDGGDVVGGEGYIFINNKIVIASILTFSEAWGTLDQMSRTLCF